MFGMGVEISEQVINELLEESLTVEKVDVQSGTPSPNLWGLSLSRQNSCFTLRTIGKDLPAYWEQ
jgi:hypothetical protein